MLKRLSEKGFRTITIIDPGVKHEPGYGVFDQAVERDVLCRTEGGDIYIGQVWPGNTAFPDFATQEAREWWGELNAAHVESGLAGIWNDMNEPATGNIDPRAMRFNRGRDSHERYHNQYALLMAMGTTQGLLAAMPDRRTFVLSRAGFAGIQRYAANWMGDNLSRWDHLWVSIPMGTGLGLSGQAFVGADIGGFAGNSNAELYLRWMQYGALTPFCRNHSEIGNVDQYAWAWGDVVQSIVREALRLRYRLMPYIYAAFLTPRRRVRRCSGRWCSTTRTTRWCATSTTSTSSGGTCSWPRCCRRDRRPGRCTYPKVTGTTGIPGRGSTGGLPAGAHADGAHPGLRPRGSGDPDVAGGAGLHRRLPPDGHRAAPVRPDGGRRAPVPPAGGRRPDLRRRPGPALPDRATLTRTGDRLELRADVDGKGYPEFAREAFRLVVHGAHPASVRLDGEEVRAVDDAFRAAQRRPRHGGRDRPRPSPWPGAGARGVPGGRSGRPA